MEGECAEQRREIQYEFEGGQSGWATLEESDVSKDFKEARMSDGNIWGESFPGRVIG